MTGMKWSDLKFWSSDAYQELQAYLALHTPYYPPKSDILNALKFTPLDKVRCVILGQDPYFDGSANGLAFSCNKFTNQCPPSLKNIFKEYTTDTTFPLPTTGDLTPWATRGVLLLNASLTVAPGSPGSHKEIGWDGLTSEILQAVRTSNPKAVFVLWGNEARNLAVPIIGAASIVTSVHPSPRSASAGFFGSRPFSKVNALLAASGSREIQWFLPYGESRPTTTMASGETQNERKVRAFPT